MLYRQRLILSMLADAGGDASHLEIVKWSFLVRHETPGGGGGSFYQFVPYHYGPFSFGLFQEAAALTRDGMILETPDKRWRLTDRGLAAAREAAQADAADARRIVLAFQAKSTDELVDYVYCRYPWFTVNSKIRREAVLPIARVAVYTAGYEGLLIDGFLNGLLQAGIGRLLDVRHNPIARRYGFHKSTLSRLCGNLGIEYVHIPALGIPSAEREGLAAGGVPERKRLLDAYEEDLPSRDRAVAGVAELISQKPSVLVCMESDPCDCHRSRLASDVARRTGLEVRHLRFAT